MSRDELSQWTPDGPDLSDDAARLLDADADASTAFDTRFPPVAFPEDPIPAHLERAVLGSTRPRWIWPAYVAIAAAWVLAIAQVDELWSPGLVEQLDHVADGPEAPAHVATAERPPPSAGHPPPFRATAPIGALALTPTSAHAESTFAEVHAGSFAHALQVVRDGALPHPADVRTEEFVNAVPYGYPEPVDPIGVSTELVASPWADDVELLRIGLQARRVGDDRPPVRLRVVVDPSAPTALLGPGLRTLARRLRADDAVTVVGLGADTPLTPSTDIAGLLARTPGPTALDRGDGRTALLVGPTAALDTLADLHPQVTVVGLGTDPADAGEGTLAVGSARDVAAVFGHRLLAADPVVARDLRIRVAFDPQVVQAWRLLGYEDPTATNARRAADIGAGHQLTALYAVKRSADGPLGTLRLRYAADGPIDAAYVLDGDRVPLDAATPDTRVAVGAATLAERLRGRRWAGRVSWRALDELLAGARRPAFREADRELRALVGAVRTLDRIGDRE